MDELRGILDFELKNQLWVYTDNSYFCEPSENIFILINKKNWKCFIIDKKKKKTKFYNLSKNQKEYIINNSFKIIKVTYEQIKEAK